jgi:hypothetical protein
VGWISRAFEGFDFADVEKRWDLTNNNKPLLAKEGKFYISYMSNGGEITIKNVPQDLPYHWFNPKTGELSVQGQTRSSNFKAPDNSPWVLIIGKKKNKP